MNRFIFLCDGIAGWLECYAADKTAARAYFAQTLGMTALPRRHVCTRIA